MFEHTFGSKSQCFGQQIKQIKNDNSRDQQDKSLCAICCEGML